MPRFQFKVLDPQRGRVRTGTLTAPDREQARLRLEKAGLEIQKLELSGAEPRRRALEVGSGYQGVERFGGVYRPTVWESLRDLELPPGVRSLLLGLVALIGVLQLASGWGREHPSSEPDPQLRPVQVALRGTVLKEPLSPDTVTVTLVLPQIPLTVEWKGDEVLDERGNLTARVSFQSRKVPGYCRLTVASPGYRPVTLGPIVLSGTGTLTARLPPLRLEPEGGG